MGSHDEDVSPIRCHRLFPTKAVDAGSVPQNSSLTPSAMPWTSWIPSYGHMAHIDS